jgi:F-type H+-transporting ATPase subunit epsilon
MPNTTILTILTPEKSVFSGPAEFIVLPGSEGELGVLPGHVALVASLRAGTVRVTAGGATRRFDVSAGFASIEPAAVKVLTTSAAPVA